MEENETILCSYNRACSRFFRQKREEYKISREEISLGIMSQNGLAQLESENGRVRWSKLNGDILMQRMGVAANHMEVMATRDELTRWRAREEIARLILENPRGAKVRLVQYRSDYRKREKIEEQFLLKMEVILMVQKWKQNEFCEEDLILKKAKKAVACTVMGSWEKNLSRYWLAPAELEALLLVAVAYFIKGDWKRAWNLQQEIWSYPEQHGWQAQIRALILPQVMLFRVKLLREKKEEERAYREGRKTLELLRITYPQRYAIDLLKVLSEISVDGEKEKEEQELFRQFRDMFLGLYREYEKPVHRIWQTVSVDNTREIGQTLYMLRRFWGKSMDEVVYENNELSISRRELQRVESGRHKPRNRYYRELMRLYQKPEEMYLLLLETESLDALALRQEIDLQIILGRWREAEENLDILKESLDINSPVNRQMMLFLQCCLELYRGNKDYGGAIKTLEKALHCTVPKFEGENQKWWVFRWGECMIAAQIALYYRYLGKLDESKNWYMCLKHSMEQQMESTAIPLVGYLSTINGYTGILGEFQEYEESIRIDEETIGKLLDKADIFSIEKLFYDKVWNEYESMETLNIDGERIRKDFEICEELALYMHNEEYLNEFLKPREKKYQLI